MSATSSDLHRHQDWYCGNVCSFHVAGARDTSLRLAEDEHVQRWLLDADMILVHAAAMAVGVDNLQALAQHYEQANQLFGAAKLEYATHVALGGASQLMKRKDQVDHEGAAVDLLERIGELNDQTQQQLLLDILGPKAFTARGDERKRVHARIEELLASNSRLRIDKINLAYARVWPRCCSLAGINIDDWDNGVCVTVSVDGYEAIQRPAC